MPLTLGDAALVLPQLLYPVPLFLRNNGLLCTGQDEHILFGVGNALFELIGLGIGLEVADTTSVLHPFQDTNHRLLMPVTGTLRRGLTFTHSIEGLDRWHLVSFEDSGNPAWADSSNRQVKDTLDHWCGFFVQNPVVLVLRVRAVAIRRFPHMFAAGAAGFHHGTDLFTGVLGIKIVKKITKRGEIIVSTLTVHPIIDGNESHIIAGKNDFRITTDLQVVPSKTAHVLDDPSAY